MFYYIFIYKNVHVFWCFLLLCFFFFVFSLEKTLKTKKNNYNIKKTKNMYIFINKNVTTTKNSKNHEEKR